MITLRKVFFRYSSDIDVIVIGGGHAGCEAAHAAARIGAKTCLITQKVQTIGEMSCNPSMGGVGKGHLIRQIQALGGLIGKISDMSATHYRMLNQSKGFSAQGLRALIDRDLYRLNMYRTLSSTPNLSILEGSVEDFTIRDSRKSIQTVKLKNGQEIRGKQVVLTTGTFLKGVIHIGNISYPAGRHRRDSAEVEPPSIGLSQTISNTLAFKLGRYKTGTPPRLLKKSVDFSQLAVQQSQDNLWFGFENQFYRRPCPNPLLNSYLTQTNEKSHEVVRRYRHILPQYQAGESGYGIGPRYCPSIESKIKKFPEKNSHPIFLQLEGANSEVVYPTGISTGLPQEAQLELIRTIKGLESAQILRPGYAVQYDFVDPKQLLPSLRTDKVQNLFLAGQINGTTGYEEAAAQGIIAGINAGLAATGRAPYLPSRTNSMIGVLIGDIIGIGITEPYRMLTTRSQNRLLQRFDNADQRLTPDALRLGLITDEQRKVFEEKSRLIKENLSNLEQFKMSMAEWKKHFPEKVKEDKPKKISAASLISKYHNISYRDLAKLLPFEPRVAVNIDVMLKYRTVLEKQTQKAQSIQKQLLQAELDIHLIQQYQKQIVGEDFEKLVREKPKNLYAASRIRGIRETTIQTLVFLAKRLQKQPLHE